MGIFIPGMICPLCGTQMLQSDQIVMFPPFVPNKRDPLHFFSDGVFHRACFEKHPLSDQATRYGDEALRRYRPEGRRCIVCSEEIRDPDDYFGAGYLTSDPASPAFVCNYIQFHRSHFGEWDRASEFYRAIEELMRSEVWDGPRVVFEPLPIWRS